MKQHQKRRIWIIDTGTSDPMIILEEIRTVIQKPIVNVKVILTECKNGNKSGVTK